jgi:hypothetical protein
LTVQKRTIRGGPPPSWAKIVKLTLLASLLGAAVASFIALQPPPPGQATTPTGYAAILGGITALSMLMQRRVKFWIIAVAVITAAILSGVWWAILGAVHAAQWAGAADAGLCPIAGVAVAWLLTLIPSRAAPALTALVARCENGWDVSWTGDGPSPRRLSAATLTEVTDQAAAVAVQYDLGRPASANDADFQIALFPHNYTKGPIFDISGGPGAFIATDKFSGRTLHGSTLEDLLQAAEEASDLRAGEYMFHWTRPVTALSPRATATGPEPAS